jgi:hypothetical protein
MTELNRSPPGGRIGQTGSLPAREEFGAESLARVGGRGSNRVDPHHVAVAGLTPMTTATEATEPLSSAHGAAQAAKRCIKVERRHPAGQQARRCHGEPQDPHHPYGQQPRQQRAGISGRCAT